VADPSAIMVHLVSKFVRECGYKVALTGEGADEFFGGYNQYFRFALARRLNFFGRGFPFLADLAAHAVPYRTRHVHFLNQVVKTPIFHGSGMIFEPHVAPDIFVAEIPSFPTVDNLRNAMWLDQRQRLADDLLCSRDRATMQASIEARVPFVTSHVANFSMSLDARMLVLAGAESIC
jgi:asparagine synthase (glutamine-hydrolysing)